MTGRVEEVGAGEWNRLLERSGQATPFHRSEFLERCARAVDARLHRYVGYKGQEPTGLFPVLERRRGPVAAALSPAPAVVPYGGPALLTPRGLKRRRRERWNRSFVESVLERVAEDVDPDYCRIRAGPAYTDERPFVWNGYRSTVRHTYVLRLPADEGRLGDRLDADGGAVSVHRDRVAVAETDRSAIGELTGLVADRGGREPPLGLGGSFLRALYRDLPDGCMRVYVCRDGDRPLGAVVTLELGETVYGWLGAADPDAGVPVYGLLSGRVLRDACRRGYAEFDTTGTGDLRAFRERHGASAELRSYPQLVRAGPVGRLAARLSGVAP